MSAERPYFLINEQIFRETPGWGVIIEQMTEAEKCAQRDNRRNSYQIKKPVTHTQ